MDALPPSTTARGRAKAARQLAILDSAARLFAAHGYDGVSLDEIGAAAGVSGPAVYRHFAGKQALLGAILLRASTDLEAGGALVETGSADAGERMDALIRFHVDFALGHPDVIRVQDRDIDRLSPRDRGEVRRLQRSYIDRWIDTLAGLLPASAVADRQQLRLRVQGAFGLLNSTPHSTAAVARTAERDATAAILAAMARAALTAPPA